MPCGGKKQGLSDIQGVRAAAWLIPASQNLEHIYFGRMTVPAQHLTSYSYKVFNLTLDMSLSFQENMAWHSPGEYCQPSAVIHS